MLAASLCVMVTPAPGQSSGQASGQQPSSQPSNPPATKPASPEANPFPGEAPQAPAAPAGAKPKPGSENPFPGEDPNAPIIPVDPGPGSTAGQGSGQGSGSGRGSEPGASPRPGDADTNTGAAARRDADPDGDPVRSPDGLGRSADDDGFSSSRQGVRQVPVEEDSDERPGKSTKSKTREAVIKEDLDVGGFYLDKKNWKAAQARFASAFALDAENPDTVWGLAETERHLQLYKEAAEHYKLFLSYDPEGKRSREARKALAEVQAAQPAGSAASGSIPPK